MKNTQQDWQSEFDNLKKHFKWHSFRWEYQKEVIIGWVVNTFFDDVVEHPDIKQYFTDFPMVKVKTLK